MAKMKCKHTIGFHGDHMNIFDNLTLGRAKKIMRHYGANTMVHQRGRIGFWRGGTFLGDYWLHSKSPYSKSLLVLIIT